MNDRRRRGEETGRDTQRRRRRRSEEYRMERRAFGRTGGKKRGGVPKAALFIVAFLFLLGAAAVILCLNDGFSFLPGSGSKKVLAQAEELVAEYNYDEAAALLRESSSYAVNTAMQEKAAEYETAAESMASDISSTLTAAEGKAESYDYAGAVETLQGSSYYPHSEQLQAKAAEYEEAEKTRGENAELALTEAAALAATYDYDGAIARLQQMAGYQANAQLQAKAAEYQAQKDACVAISPEEVTHIFYHSLVVDPSKAFVEGEAGYDGWQQWMTTTYEFDQITQSMYDRGYVLVSIYDLFTKTTAEDGTVTIEPKQVYLPEGKKAYVLSLDDLCYYHTYDDHGVASKMVLDEEGKPTCEYIQDDGTVVYGDYDAVPRLDAFMEEHPDGCYHGARGTIALTGYDGILGYRTDGAYSEEHNTNADIYYADEQQLQWLSEHPDFDWEQECEDAKTVVEALKADGWTFASHTWGHKAVGDATYDELVQDTERWMEYVSPLIGGTDIIIFAHGQDISDTGTYDSSNEKYNYLKSQGFDVYCNVDSTPYTTTVTSEYFHQGRRNLDGYRIYQDLISDSPLASDLFDAASVIDPDRPLPVPEL